MHLDDHIEEKARNDSGYAIAYALLQVAKAQRDTGIAIKNLDLAFIGERLEVAAGAIADGIRDKD